MREECVLWLALSRVPGLGGVGFKKLAEHFTPPTLAFEASEEELARVEGLERPAIEGILNFAGWEELAREATRLSEGGIAVIPYSDCRYPSRLKVIHDPPAVLYLKGRFLPEDDQAVAIVGSRSASEYGLRTTRKIATRLAELGFAVVSGMARGIDGEAHRSVLAVHGRTIAVLGSGVDVIYPPEHGALYREISARGAVVSELAPGTQPLPYHFPWRNRLISGLSLGVVVVEATEKSGSLITATLATEQGREVFAVPGEAGSSRSRGTHRLIREGAKLVERAEDIIEEVAPQLAAASGAPAGGCSLPPEVTGEARRVFDLLAESSVQIDELIQKSGLPPARISELLLDLEIRGLVEQLPGKRFRAAL